MPYKKLENFMTVFNIQEAKTPEEILACYPVIIELRSHLIDAEKYVQQVIRLQKEACHLMFVAEDETIKSILGYRIQESLHRGKILYIDELGTLSTARSKDYASVLLDWAMDYAKAQGCDSVHLDSGHARVDAHRLYLNKKFYMTAHHFSCKF
jgi:GNAT superfamily N-acetyltransferase